MRKILLRLENSKGFRDFLVALLVASVVFVVVIVCSLLADTVGVKDAEAAQSDKSVTITHSHTYPQNTAPSAVVISKSQSRDVNTIEDNSEEVVEEEQEVISDYTINVYEENKTLYTNDRVNVRSGAGTEYEKLATLSVGAKVTVIGETNNGWYQVLYNDDASYIKSDYLQEKAIPASFIFAGDSRTVQMNQAVGKSEYTWVAQVGEGYSYFANTAIPAIDASVRDGSVIVINFGVNDLYNVDKYISKVNSKVDSWISAGATVYYAAVLPVSDYPTITNGDITAFNSKISSGLDSRIGWLDGYTYLQNNGFNTADGLHFDYDTYRDLYAYYMSKITA